MQPDSPIAANGGESLAFTVNCTGGYIAYL